LKECANEKLQRKRLKVMEIRGVLSSELFNYNNSLRSGSFTSPTYSMCQNEKIRALNKISNQIKSE
jgi:hypothetical protein